jgi:hypothetical protein
VNWIVLSKYIRTARSGRPILVEATADPAGILYWNDLPYHLFVFPALGYLGANGSERQYIERTQGTRLMPRAY